MASFHLKQVKFNNIYVMGPDKRIYVVSVHLKGGLGTLDHAWHGRSFRVNHVLVHTNSITKVNKYETLVLHLL